SPAPDEVADDVVAAEDGAVGKLETLYRGGVVAGIPEAVQEPIERQRRVGIARYFNVHVGAPATQAVAVISIHGYESDVPGIHPRFEPDHVIGDHWLLGRARVVPRRGIETGRYDA